MCFGLCFFMFCGHGIFQCFGPGLFQYCGPGIRLLYINGPGRQILHRGPPLPVVSRLVWHRGSLQPALFRPAPGTVPECPDKAGLPRRWPSGALQRPPASSTKIGKITSRIEKIGVNAFFLAKNIFFQKICLYLQSQTERFSVAGNIWRDAGVVDRAALEMRCTGNCTGGSNPSLSARHT